MRAVLLAIALLSMLSMPLMAQPSNVDAKPSAEAVALGYQIARATNSEALTRAQLNKMLGETLPKQFAASPDFVELESRFPGISAAYIAKLSPMIIDAVILRLPELWAKIGPVYSRSFTESELSELLKFYRGPAGTRMIEVIGKRGDFTRLLNEAIRAPGAEMSAESLRSGLDIGIRSIGSEMSAADKVEIQRLESSPLGPKLLAIRSEITAISVDWGNEPSPENEAQIEAVTKTFFEGYFKDRAEGKVAP